MNGGPNDGEVTPPDPLTALGEAAVTMKTLFDSYIASGFSEYQACIIIGTAIALGGRGS